MHGLKAPSLEQLERYNVNVEGQPEVIFQPLYDFQEYPIIGFTELSFFQVPEGQQGKTFDDTNMSITAALPVPINMAITDIQIWFFPGTLISTTDSLVGVNWNDVNAVLKAGNLQIEIGSKEYLVDAPLLKFPPHARLDGAYALSDTSTAGGAQITRIDYASATGAVYNIVPLRLISQQNFVARVRFSSLVPLPSFTAGRIGVHFGGFRYRLAQ